MMHDINKYSIERCDIFDFMANFVGMTVLHPGGLKATHELAKLCCINKDTKVLDIACGKGTSSYYFAKNFGCEVVGIDIDENLIDQAKRLAVKKKMEDKLTFKVANAESLPFSDDEFDVSIFQAVLPLVSDKEKVIKEAIRVTRPGGYIGFLEPSYQKQPSKEFFEKDIQEICAECMKNILTHDGLRSLIFNKLKLEEVETKIYEWECARNVINEMREMIKNEGITNTLKVMLKWLYKPRIRKRMNAIGGFFRRNKEYFGYGIHIGEKSE